MPGMMRRLGAVVRAELNELRGRRAAHEDADAGTRATPDAPRRPRATRPDVESAWRMLELDPGASLDDVRAAYRRLATRYHPRTLGGSSGEAARTVVEALTEALEVLEEHLLPVPPGGPGAR